MEHYIKRFGSGDYAIHKKDGVYKICKLVERAPETLDLFRPKFGSNLADYIRPAGLSEEDQVRIENDASRWVVEDENTGERFVSEGCDLMYVNPMQVIAFMAMKDGERESREGHEGGDASS